MSRARRAIFISLLIVASTQGARIFRNPEPHLPAENVPVEKRDYLELPRPEEDSFFGPDAWRPVRDPEFSGRRRLASSGVDVPVASSRNLRLKSQRSAAEDGTPPPSASAPSTTLGQSIVLVANQLLQGSNVVESRTPEGSTTTSVGWSQDVRTPPKLMLQVHKLSDDEPGKKPIKDDPMEENFFPSRRHPPQHGSTTPEVAVTKMAVTSKQAEQTLPFFADREKNGEKHLSTASVSVNRKSTAATTTTTSTPLTTPTTPTSVKWKIAIPMNRPTRFPLRKPMTTSSPITSLNDTPMPTNSGPTNNRFSTSSGGSTRPNSLSPKISSRQPTSTTIRNIPTSNSGTTVSTVEKKKPMSNLTTVTITLTTTTPPLVTTISAPTTTTTSMPTVSMPAKRNHTSEALSKVKNTEMLPKSTEAVEVEILGQSKITKLEKNEAAENDVNKEDSVTTTTPQPQRPSNKRKKNKNRRRRPSKKPSPSQAMNGSELEIKESPQEGSPGNAASPLSTRIYNFIAREVMPSMSVGLLGLVVTAGLAGYFLLPTLGGLQRRSDATADGLTVYGSGGAYGGQEDGGIITSIFQNVMASVRNGEEFERGPRRRRNVTPMDEEENEIDAILNDNSNKLTQAPLTADTTTASSATIHTQSKDDMKNHLMEPSNSQDEVSHFDSSTGVSAGDEEPTTTEAIKDINHTQDLIPSYYWDAEYDDNPFSLMGIFRRVVDFKLKIGVSLLRATTEVIARYLEDVQKRLRDSDRHDWLRSLGLSVRRIRRTIESEINTVDDSKPTYPSKRFTKQTRTKRHG